MTQHEPASPPPLPVVIIRHPRERLSKCTLEPLRGRRGFTFHKATPRFRFDCAGYILLALDAPQLSAADLRSDSAGQAPRGLLLLDSTWRLLPTLNNALEGEPIKRTLSVDTKTAYPRISKVAEDPEGGLASIEALYLALRMLGHDDKSLLKDYYWREAFLKQF